MNEPSPTKKKNIVVSAGKYFGEKVADYIIGTFIAAAAITALTFSAVYQEEVKTILSKNWRDILFVAGGFVAGGSVAGVGAALLLRRSPPRQEVVDLWEDLTPVTGLTKFEERNQNSPYMPSQILARPSIASLSVMANGCSKWTRLVPAAEARNKFKRMVDQNRPIQFLASCPIHLSKTGDPAKIAKAIKNAKSLLLLKGIREETGASTASFGIRTYKHTATIRLIIIDGKECVVGHYKEGGDGDSLLTPLLIFECNDEKEWGFGHAFFRLFNSEWHRSSEPTTEEWKEIDVLASQGVSL